MAIFFLNIFSNFFFKNQLSFLGRMKQPFSQNVANKQRVDTKLPAGYLGAGYLGIQGNQLPSNQAYGSNRKAGSSTVWSPKGLFQC